ncbi:MAG: AIPR family protein [Chitinophagales bacterium]|nr:AIPR family protein [Chitinophagales bacterium]
MTNEPIINARFKKFKENYGLTGMADGDAFERFVNNAILTSHQPDAFSADSELLEKICVGGLGDTGIDGLAIKVNGLLIKSSEEIDDIVKKFRRANVEFIFLQSKYKDKFEASELNTFIAGVRNFLSATPAIPMNEKLQEFLGIKDHLLSDEITYFWENNPSVRMYYVAMGKWRNLQHHQALADQAKADIKSLNVYENVELHFVDSDSLKTTLDNNENNFTAFIEAIDTMGLTPVNGVDDSCVALCKADEFAKILTSEEGVIRKSLFDDNVRDFQGENSVNNEILDTIKTDPSKFILLNNGITIVCDEFTINNRRLKIVNPQIVNGCQTSHVIFSAKTNGNDISQVPLNVKVISTKDPEISNDIVRGTNRQNNVLEEAFEATKAFHKDLEAFFNSYCLDLPEKIYYERRAKQYVHNPTIKQTQKMNLRIVTQYFTGMFLNKPHLSHRHESFLLRELSNILYQETQSKLPYFVTSYSFYKLEKLFREYNFHKELTPYKAHLLMMFRESIGGRVPNLSHERPIDEYATRIMDILKNDDSTKKHFENVALIFKKSMKIWIEDLGKSRFAIKDVEEFTNLLLRETQRSFNIKDTEISDDADFVYTGVVMNTLLDRFGNPCGFIKRYPNNAFFHSQQNKSLRFSQLKGKVVSYKIGINPKDGRPLALNVRLLNDEVGLHQSDGGS